jgi:hypothetical protein
MSRITDLFVLAGADAIEGLGSPLSQLPARGIGKGVVGNVRDFHSGYGLFIEYAAAKPAQILDYLDDSDQTLVAYGISVGDLRDLVNALPNRALDRIVEPGRAMDFATVWDGTDLFEVLVRKVTLPWRTPSNKQQ